MLTQRERVIFCPGSQEPAAGNLIVVETLPGETIHEIEVVHTETAEWLETRRVLIENVQRDIFDGDDNG